MANPHLGVVLSRCSTNRNRGFRDLNHLPRRHRRLQRPPNARGPPRLRGLCHRFPRRSLLLRHSRHHVPRNPNLALPGEGFRPRSAAEASHWVDFALCLHSFYARLVLRRTHIRVEQRVPVRGFSDVRRHVSPRFVLRSRAVSALF